MTELQRREVALTPVEYSELWEGPLQELRARLRDEAKDRRVKPYGEVIERPGLPRGWVLMRVHFTDEEIERVRRFNGKRKVWPWVAVGVTSLLAGVGVLGWWVYTVIAAAVAGVSFGALVGVGIVAALLFAAGGTATIVEVTTKVRVWR